MPDETNMTPEELAAVEAASATEEAFDNGPREIDILKDRATKLGVAFSPNIGIDKLKERIEEHLAKDDDKGEGEAVVKTASPAQEASDPSKPRAGEIPPLDVILQMDDMDILSFPKHLRTRIIRAKQRSENLKLVRCQIHNNNPAKNDLKGEILTAANKYVGVVKKFIPFGDVTQGGYHVPFILLEQIKRRKYQKISVVKLPNGMEQVNQSLAPEFTIVELPPLTKDQLDELALRQSAAERVGLI